MKALIIHIDCIKNFWFSYIIESSIKEMILTWCLNPYFQFFTKNNEETFYEIREVHYTVVWKLSLSQISVSNYLCPKFSVPQIIYVPNDLCPKLPVDADK